jgi:Xaa-Pro aminopeptidase
MAKRKSNDYLSAQFHKERRAALRTKLPQNSVALFFSNPFGIEMM